MKKLKIGLAVFLLPYVPVVLTSTPVGNSTPVRIYTACCIAAAAIFPLIVRLLMRKSQSSTIVAFFLTPLLLLSPRLFSDTPGYVLLAILFWLPYFFPVWTIVCILMHSEPPPNK